MSTPGPFPDTYGWDTVFAITILAASEALMKRASSPTYTATIPVSDATATLTWNLTQWEIIDVPDGGSMTIRMKFGPGSTLVAPLTPPGSGLGTYRLDTAEFDCEVTFLAYFTEATAGVHLLKARTANAGAWASVKLKTPAGFGFNTSIMLTLLTDWFNNAPEAVLLFDEEFLSLDMNEAVDNELVWLKPKHMGFAGGTMADGVTKAIGLLAMTERQDPAKQRSPAGARLALSPYLIPAGATAAFQMSRELVMANMFLPTTAATFGHDEKNADGTFQLSADGSQIRNVKATSFTEEIDGATRNVSIDTGNLTVTLDGDQLNMAIRPLTVETHILGLLVDATIDERLEMTLIERDADSKTFMLMNRDPQTPAMSHRYNGTATITLGVIGAVIAVVGAALAVVGVKGALANKLGLSAFAAKYTARAVGFAAALAGVLISLITTIITSAEPDDVKKLPSIDNLLNTALARIKWPSSTRIKFVAESGSFANGIRIVVRPVF